MELKLIVLSLACFFLFMRPAVGSLPIVKETDSVIKGASLSDAGLASKEKEALPAAQGPAKLTHTDAAIKDIGPNSAALNANLGAVMVQRPVYYPTFPLNTAVVAPPCPNIFDILSGVWRAVRNKVVIAKQVLQNMICPPVVQYISRPNLYPMPVVGCFNQFKRK